MPTSGTKTLLRWGSVDSEMACIHEIKKTHSVSSKDFKEALRHITGAQDHTQCETGQVIPVVKEQDLISHLHDRHPEHFQIKLKMLGPKMPKLTMNQLVSFFTTQGQIEQNCKILKGKNESSKENDHNKRVKAKDHSSSTKWKMKDKPFCCKNHGSHYLRHPQVFLLSSQLLLKQDASKEASKERIQ